MVAIKVDDAEMLRGLADLQTKLIRLRPVLRDIGERLLISTRERFSAEQSPDGTSWKPLSNRYAAQKRKKGRSNKILQLNGYLFGSLTYQASDTQLVLGTNRTYARIHQFGGSYAIPPRSGSVKLRTTASGALLKRGNLAVFANSRHKRFVVRDYLREGYMVNVPARPFLGISASDRTSISRIITFYLSGN